MNVNLSDVRKRGVTITEYINGLDEPIKQKYLARKQKYQIQPGVLDELKERAHKYFVIAFSASWCKDCAQHIPVLDLIAEKTGLEVRVFGGIKKDPLSHTSKWRVPPSPPEVLTFGVEKIPLIIVFNQNGTEIGRIVESPKRFLTVEQELVGIVSSN
jgi:thiol-disulfide isomerase/thioredoxin